MELLIRLEQESNESKYPKNVIGNSSKLQTSTSTSRIKIPLQKLASETYSSTYPPNSDEFSNKYLIGHDSPSMYLMNNAPFIPPTINQGNFILMT